MSQLRRFEKCGASFTDRLDSIIDLKKRGWSITGKPTIVNSPIGKGMKFNGTTDYINSGEPTSARLIDFNNGGSIVFWVYFDTFGSANIIGNGDNVANANSTFGWSVYSRVNAGNNSLEVQQKYTTNQSRNVSTTTNLSTGQWYHVVITYDSSTASNKPSIYINNNSESVTTNQTGAGAITLSTGNLYIGSNSLGNSDFTGRVSGVIYIPRILSANEVSGIYTGKTFDYDTNEINRWDLSELNPQDLGVAQLRNNAVGTGAIQNNITNGHNRKTKAINFDGSTSQVKANDNNLPMGTSSRTLSIWVKPAVVTGSYFIAFSYGSSNAPGLYALGTDKNTLKWNISTGAEEVVGNVAQAGMWNHIVTTYDGTTHTIYENGIKTGNGTMTTNTTLTGSTSIGYQNGAPTYIFNGLIDDPRVFSSSLTNLQVTDLYRRNR